VPPSKETPNINSKDRKKAVDNPAGEKAAGKPRAADKPKAASKPKAAGKPRAADKPTAAGKPKVEGKPKAAENRKDPSKPKPADNRQAKQSLSSLKSVVVDALADMKALDVKVLDVRELTDIADFMVIASGTSDRHVRSVAQRVVEKTKEAGFRPHGVEGQQDSDWVLIDLNEMIVHVMLPRVREFYGLEKLWDMTATKRAARA
jgi:ribosome-associated protein